MVYITKYEKQIYHIVNFSDNHMTAEEIFDSLREIYPDVALATVYNNLKKLCDEGLIRKISLEGSIDKYDRIKKHDHLVCKKCGKLSDVCLGDLTASLQELSLIHI